MKKIHCLSPITRYGTELFPAGYEMANKAADANAVPVRNASMHDTELPEDLLAVGRAGAGANDIPLDSRAQKGIVVFNTPRVNTNGVKELMIAGMLMASRDIVNDIGRYKANTGDDSITKGTEGNRKAFAGYETKGKKLEVIGLGVIRAEVASATTHLEMEACGYDPYISINAVRKLSRNVEHITSADITFQECGYITTHIPLTGSTGGMISKEKPAIMKDGVVTLNFSRDTLVNDGDMAEALDVGKVRYYVNDFPNSKVANMGKVILLPHLGASTKESEDDCAVIAAKELTDHPESGDIKNSVNLPSCGVDMCQTENRVTVLHMNIPNMIGQTTAILTEQGMNTSDMTNKSRGKYAYTLLDLRHKTEDSTIQKLRAIKGVLRVRVVK